MTDYSVQREDGPGALAMLVLLEPDAKRDTRVRARCRAALDDRRRRHIVRNEPGWRFAIGLAIAPVVVGTACAVYLFEVISRAMQLYRF
jgi:hypothetical protein